MGTQLPDDGVSLFSSQTDSENYSSTSPEPTCKIMWKCATVVWLISFLHNHSTQYNTIQYNTMSCTTGTMTTMFSFCTEKKNKRLGSLKEKKWTPLM